MDHCANRVSRQTTTLPRPADPSPGTMQIARSWPRPARLRTTYIISMYKCISSLASSSPSLALDAIADDLKISNSVARVLPMSIYLMGYAIGPLLIAPLADTFGRIRLLQISSVVFVVCNRVAGFANDNATMLAMRLLSGIGGSGPITVRILSLPHRRLTTLTHIQLGASILSDCWTKAERPQMMTVYTLPALIGPALGPILGAFATTHLSWRWSFWIVSAMSLFIQLLGLIFLSETHIPLSQSTVEGHNKVLTVGHRLMASLKQPFKLFVAHSIVQLVALYSALTYGTMYLAIASFHTVWTEVYRQRSDLSSLNYVALAVGFFVGSFGSRQLNAYCQRKLHDPHSQESWRPEHRVPSLVVGAFLIPVGLLALGWSAQAHIFPLLPVAGAAVFASGTVVILQFTSLYIVDCYETRSSSALSGVTVVRSLAGFTFPLFASKMFKLLGYGWGNTLLALVSIAFGGPLPFIVWKLGPQLRRNDIARSS
jgi:MFS family permease